MATRNNYSAFYALLRRLPGADKDQVVSQWTAGRTTSLREMTDKEYATMIRELRGKVDNIEAKRKARSAVLKQMQLYGVNTASWDTVDRFCRSPKIAGKRFCLLSLDELEKLRLKMLSIRGKDTQKANRQHREELGVKLTEGQIAN